MVKKYKCTAILIVGFCYFVNYSSGQVPNSSNTLLRNYLAENDFFRLRDTYNLQQSKLDLKDKLYFKAYIDNAFNHCISSQQVIGSLLTSNQFKLTNTEIAGLLKLKMDNDVKLFRYSQAAQTGDKLLSQYSNTLDTADLADIRNSNKIWHALAQVPPQQNNITADTWLDWKRDIAGLMTIPVTANGQPSDFVFDTGANFSTISQSYAKKFNMQLIQTSFSLGSGTSIVNQATLAIAGKLQIGNITLTNVVFLVLPDDQLIFPSAHYEIHGIIGFPVIASLGEIHLYKNGKINIPVMQKVYSLKNLALDGLIPVISMKTDRDTLSYRFDTGAKQTELFSNYFDKYRDEISKESKADTIQRGSAGGIAKIKAYHLQDFSVYAGGKKITLHQTDVLAEPFANNKEYYYGNIGQDLISQFNEMIINFKQMFIDFN